MLNLILIWALIYAMIYVGYRLYKKIEEERKRKEKEEKVDRPIIPSDLIYKQYELDYENMGDIVWRCLCAVHRKCSLESPGTVDDIYCEKVANRIGCENNVFVFRYEVDREKTELFGGGGKKVSRKVMDEQSIAEIIQEELPFYMKNGYYFSGQVCVWKSPGNRIRIEIYGVNRNANWYVEDLII